MLLRNVPKYTVKELIKLKTGHTLSDAFLTELKQTVVINKFKKSENELTTDILLCMMEYDPNVEFCAYFINFSDAKQNVWVRKRTCEKRCKKRNAAV